MNRTQKLKYLKRHAFTGIILLAGILALHTQVCAAQDMADNAALQYWKAAGVMLQPTEEAQFSSYEFINKELPNLAPNALAANPDALLNLLKETPMLNALQNGAAEEVCVFPIYRKGNPRPELSHLKSLFQVTQRALACAKAYEFAGNPVGAAEIYVSLLKTIQDLDQDHTIYSCLAGANMLQLVLNDLVGFISRGQPADAFIPLTNCFRDSPEFIFHPSNALREERERYANWLSANPDLTVKKLERLYGKTKFKPAAERLMTLDATTKKKKLEEWLEGYRRWMLDLSRALNMPYKQGMKRLKELDARKTRMRKDKKGGPNPLILLLTPTTTELYQRILLAEAQFDMADILCMAGLYKAEVGEWPRTLNELHPLSYRTMPTDPFIDEPFYYRVFHGAPLIITRIPKWMARTRQYSNRLSLSERRQKDKQRTAHVISRYKKEQAEEIKKPVPLK